MTTFLSPEQPTISRVGCHRYDSKTRGPVSVVDFDNPDRRTVLSFQIDDPAVARQLLAAAFEAVKILDPDAASDALLDLIDDDALTVIRRRIAEQEAPEAGRVTRLAQIPPAGERPVRQVRTCARCGVTSASVPMLPLTGEDGFRCWSAERCAERAAAKAGAR